MRRTFVDILKGRDVDLRTEYRRLYSMVYEQGFNDVMRVTFHNMPFKGTATDLEDFELECNFTYYRVYEELSLDRLFGFMEYIYNYARCIELGSRWPVFQYHENACQVTTYIEAMAQKFDCEFKKDGDYFILLERNSEAWAAAEVAPEGVVDDLIGYSYRGLSGDLKAKREKLNNLILELEPKRGALSAISKSLSSDVFRIANNFNIRHNNISEDNGGKYNEKVASMSPVELEDQYDDLYRLCVAAFILLHHEEVGVH